MEKSCIFCRIIAGEVATELVASYDTCIVIKDRSPQAEIHWLVIPRVHVTDLRELPVELMGGLFAAVQRAIREKAENRAFKLVVNNGEEAGQCVFHLHLHLLAGRGYGAAV